MLQKLSILMQYDDNDHIDKSMKAISWQMLGICQEMSFDHHAAYTRGIQYFCPFAFKARSTTLILVECITFHQTSLLDDVHKVLVVFTGHKLCFWYMF